MDDIIAFHTPTLDDRAWIRDLLDGVPFMNCEYGFGNMFLWIKLIDQAFRHSPFAKNIPPEEHAGIHGPVSLLHPLRERQVILHGEVQVQQVLIFPFFDPVLFEPVRR